MYSNTELLLILSALLPQLVSHKFISYIFSCNTSVARWLIRLCDSSTCGINVKTLLCLLVFIAAQSLTTREELSTPIATGGPLNGYIYV